MYGTLPEDPAKNILYNAVSVQRTAEIYLNTEAESIYAAGTAMRFISYVSSFWASFQAPATNLNFVVSTGVYNDTHMICRITAEPYTVLKNIVAFSLVYNND